MQTLAAAGIAGGIDVAHTQTETAWLKFGVCADMSCAGRLEAMGYDFIEGGVGGVLKPDTPDAEYAPELEKLKSLALPIRSCNGFLSPKFRLTGPEARFDPALEYAETACRRADLLGIPFIVLGSGGARKVPEGYDLGKGKEQFIEFCRKIGDRIKDCKVTIVIEPLNRAESNLLNSVAEGVAYVDAINRPRVQLLADFYHMLKEGEAPDAIRKAGARICHCHIAELEGRKAPGAKGEDLSVFFKALRDIGYAGGVSCECGWPKEDIEGAWARALAAMRAQSNVR